MSSSKAVRWTNYVLMYIALAMPRHLSSAASGLLATLLSVLLAACSPAPDKATPPVVLAASSLQESLEQAADSWAAAGHPRPVLSFAASSALARQAENGAPADIFFSADEKWMDELEAKGLVRSGTRLTLLGNRIVLVAPKDSAVRVALDDPHSLDAVLGDGRLSMADPDAVPAGKYGKAALEKLGIWPSVEDRIARGENVRAALALVERGEAPLGIVYATDAAASGKVRVVATFPEASHPPIRYPVAILKTAVSPDAQGFRDFLASDAGRAVFRRFGFTDPR